MNDIHLPIIGQQALDDLDIDTELAAFEARERQRLGLEEDPEKSFWRDTMVDQPFTRADRANTTILIGGLPEAQDFLIPAALKPLGYTVRPLPQPDTDSLKYGKEFGNRAQCNPTYFTVGNLVKYLCFLRDEQGIPAEEIVNKWVFLTAGSCGPCRFGMYTTEYRKALRDAGFQGFRVMFFQEKGGIDQVSGEDAGLDLSPAFFMALGRAVITGDVLNGLGYRVRPYEINEGETNQVLAEYRQKAHETLEKGERVLLVLNEARKRFAQIPVDRTRVKPAVGLTGEFWAMMNDGAGSYHLQKFLEGEGAEVKVQFIADWMLYNVWEERRDLDVRVDLREIDQNSARADVHNGTYAVAKRKFGLFALDQLLRRSFDVFANIGGYYGHKTQDVEASRKLVDGLIDSENRGGEGHQEVAHNIMNFAKKKANMTLSVKPFGCLPSSSISDGIQSKVAEMYPGAIFCAVETSGDGAVNFYSRVQLFLFKAQQQAQKEFDAALEETGLTREQVREYTAKHGDYFSALHVPKKSGKAACTAANHVYEVHAHMNTTPVERAMAQVEAGLDAARSGFGKTVEAAPELAKDARILAGELALAAKEFAQSRLPWASA